MHPPKIDLHLMAEEAAAALRLTENALAKMRHSGDGPPFLKIGRRVRYPQVQFQEWLDARYVASTSASSGLKKGA